MRFFFLMIRRPPRSTLDRSSAASDVYKRQTETIVTELKKNSTKIDTREEIASVATNSAADAETVSYTHLRAHETVLDLVCRLLLEQKTG